MAEVAAEQNTLPMSPELALEMESLKTTERAALLMLLLGEQQASDFVGYLNPKEVQALGSAMVGVNDVSQEAVDLVLDEFISELKKQTNLGLGSPDYIEGVLPEGETWCSEYVYTCVGGVAIKGDLIEWDQPEIDAIDAANAYKEARKEAYPRIEDQLDDIYHNGVEGWKATIQAIKDEHPKPQ